MDYILYSRDAGRSEQRDMTNGHQLRGSPVQFFGEAKETVIDIFNKIAEYIDEIGVFVQEICEGGCFEGLDFENKSKDLRENVKGIMDVIARDHMKVVFLGRTSNGKSTVINAMLREKILPSGIGQTTNCFLQVEGGLDSQEAFLVTEGEPNKQKPIQSIKQLAHALSSEKLEASSLIRIVWPKEKCRLLKEDVVFVDSPGIDVTPDRDKWIDKFCLDADVFVLVANAESTLTQTEKDFFHKVKERRSKPNNLFILQNRWDNSVSQEDVNEVRLQHLEWAVNFLVDELGVTDTEQDNERVFFVSALEVLASRLKEDKGIPIPDGIIRADFEARLLEFETFEQKFEESISISAVRTKFERHTQRGKEVTEYLRELMNKIVTLCKEQSDSKKSERQKKAKHAENTRNQLSVLRDELTNKIKVLQMVVKQKVSAALTDDIRILPDVIDEFKQEFQSDEATLRRYKEALHEHVDERLRCSLQTKCSADLTSRFEATKTEIIGKLTALMPEEQVLQSAPQREFEIEYPLDCRSLCAYFKEDIEFRSSWSKIISLMQESLGLNGARKRMLGCSDTVTRPMPMAFQTPVNQQYQPSMTQASNMMSTIHNIFACLTSKTTVGILAVGGIVLNAVRSKVIAVTAVTAVTGCCLMLCIGGGVYIYERVTWNNAAKEQAFKKQYVDYVSEKYPLIVFHTTLSCSDQVQRELTSTFEDLYHKVDCSAKALEKEIKHLDDKIAKLPDITTKANDVSNKTGRLVEELNCFTEQYLKA